MEQPRWRRPKYLAQNFLTTALQQRRSQLDNMLIVPPQHMELINGYIHSGWLAADQGGLDGNAYDKPWQWLMQNQAVYGLDAGSNEGVSCDNESLHLEFTALISSAAGSSNVILEKFDSRSKRSQRSDNDETGSDIDLFLLSQDIESAIERFLPSSSSMHAGDDGHSPRSIPNDARLAKEDFLPAKLNEWSGACSNDEDLRDQLLEAPESPAHLTSLLTLLPTADDLVTRLKPKLIQDPLLDGKGQPFTHQRLFRGDLLLDEDFTQSAKSFNSSRTSTVVYQFEQFSRDDSVAAFAMDCTDMDPILEICVHETSKGMTLPLAEFNRPHLQLPSPDKEFMDQLVDPSSGNTELLKFDGEPGEGRADSDGLQDERTPIFSPALRSTKSDLVDFVKLNNHDVSIDSDDSGLGHALLESPLLPPPLSPPTATPLTTHLAKLEPLPLSPGEKIVILSPAQREKILLELWQKDKVFDTILALSLPYPDIDDALISGQVNTVAEALAKLNVKSLKLDGDAELELTWDPLGESCHEMIVAEQSLISKQPLGFVAIVTLSRKYLVSKWRESFRSDSWVKHANEEGMEMPLSFHSITRNESETASSKTVSNISQGESDVPSLHLRDRSSSGYQCKAAPHVTNSHRQPKLTESVTASSSNLRAEEESPKRLDPQAAAWEIIQLSNSRIGSNPSALLYSSLRGNRDQTNIVDSLTATNGGRYGKNRQLISSPTVMALNDANAMSCSEDNVESFMMLRFSETTPTPTPERRRKSVDENTNLRKEDVDGDDMELIWSETVSSPSIRDVYLTGEYKAVADKIVEHASSLLALCKSRGLRLPHTASGSSIQQHFPSDSVKFFLKEKQKMLEDLHNTEREGEVFQECQLAAGLFLVGTVLDMLTHCSLSTAIGKFTSLTEKYKELILHGSIEPVREGLSELQAACREHRVDPHPKLREIVNAVRNWKKSQRKSWQEKIVIVLVREFNSLSGDILDLLQVIPELKSCVFSFTSNGPSDPLYTKAIEERFVHYDCVVVPESSVSGQTSFPWERVTLLIEYEPLKQPLFKQNEQHGGPSSTEAEKSLSVERLKLREYLVLRTAFRPSNGDMHAEDMSLYQYKLIASENVTNNGQLLQFLESKHSIVMVERDYYSHFKGEQLEGKHKSCSCNYADIIVDQSVGLVLRPMSLLSTDAGLKTVISTTTALSFQFEAIWILLYTGDRQQYPFSGSAPTNLARLHASISHYSSAEDRYQVRILIASGVEETAQIVRRIAEETHRNSKVWSFENWLERKWIREEMTEREKTLLTFPCLNSFSAQLMLDKFSLVELLAMDPHQLQDNLPWIPIKILKLFHKICHISAVTGTAIGDQFIEHYATINSAQNESESDSIQCPNPENSFSIPSSFQISDDSAQRDNPMLRDKTQRVRFNVHDLCNGDSIENGLSTVEEHGSLPEVIVLSSDEEQPPKPKRAKPLPPTNTTGSFTITEPSVYSHPATGENQLVLVNTLPHSPPHSHEMHDAQNLNDSLEEFEMLRPPLECPLGEVQSATSVNERHHDIISMDQHYRGAVAVEQSSSSIFGQILVSQHPSTNNSIYGDFNITIGDQHNSAAVSTPLSYSKQDSLFNPFSTKSISSSNSAVDLLQSTYWGGKTPTQKQIRESVRNTLADYRPKPGSYDPFPPPNNHITNTARMAREYFSSGTPPAGFLAGAIVRKAPPPTSSNLDGNHTVLSSESHRAVQRTPVKSLNLGRDDRKMIRLQSDDRAMIVGSASHDDEPVANFPAHVSNTVFGGTSSYQEWQRATDCEGVVIGNGNDYHGENEGNYPNSTYGSGVNERRQASSINRFADLKAFHQLQNQPSGSTTHTLLPSSNNHFNITANTPNSLKQAESRVFDDPWMGCGVIGPPAKAKRPHPGADVGKPSSSHSLPAPPTIVRDGLVPSSSIISPTTSMDSSLYGSPNTSSGSVKLSPLQKRRLVYQRDPGSADGQTKLHFS